MQRHETLVVGIVSMTRDAARAVDLGGEPAQLVVKPITAYAAGLLLHAQAPCSVIVIAGSTRRGGSGSFLDGNQAPTGVVELGQGQAACRGHRDTALAVVVDGSASAIGIHLHQQPAHAIVGGRTEQDFAGPCTAAYGQGLQQLAVGTMNIFGDLRSAIDYPVAVSVDSGVEHAAAEIATVVPSHLGNMRPGLVTCCNPRDQPCLAQGGLRRQAGKRIGEVAIGNLPCAQPPGIVAELHHIAGRADYETQALSTVVDMPRDLGRTGRRLVPATAGDIPGRRQAVANLVQQLVACAEQARHGYARWIALENAVATFIVDIGQHTAVAIDPDDIACSIVGVGGLEDLAVFGGRLDNRQLPFGVVDITPLLVKGIAYRRTTAGQVIAECRGAGRIGDRLDPILAAHQLISKTGRAAVALADAGDAEAVTVIGVIGAIDVTVGDAVVVGCQVGLDTGQRPWLS
ncbi:hypothetical protein D3C76_593200 [compost metagenome]